MIGVFHASPCGGIVLSDERTAAPILAFCIAARCDAARCIIVANALLRRGSWVRVPAGSPFPNTLTVPNPRNSPRTGWFFAYKARNNFVIQLVTIGTPQNSRLTRIRIQPSKGSALELCAQDERAEHNRLSVCTCTIFIRQSTNDSASQSENPRAHDRRAE
jgi:hypothetical protein